MAAARRFTRRLLAAIDRTTWMKIRSGDHRFIYVWPVVVNGRVYVRSWNDTRTGWFRAFLEEPRGAIVVDEREAPIRGVRRSGERLMVAMEEAYAAKYTTPASLKYVKGFKSPRRRAATMELMPR